MSYDIIEILAVISWGIASTFAVLIIVIVADTVDRWTDKRFRLLLVLVAFPSCFAAAYFVGVRMVGFVMANVYVAKDSVTLVVEKDNVSEYSTPGWHKLESPADDLFDWPNEDVVIFSVFERSGLIGGDQILVVKVDLVEMSRAEIYSKLRCRNTSCLLNVVASKMRAVYFREGCENIDNSLLDFQKFGVRLRETAYCR